MVKALDLRSNGHMSAWVRTPLLVRTVLKVEVDTCLKVIFIKNIWIAVSS